MICIEEKERRKERVAVRSEFYISEQICPLKTNQKERKKNARSCKHLCLQRHWGYAVMRRQRKTLFIQGAVWYGVWNKHVACHCGTTTKKTQFQVELMAFIKYEKSNFKGNLILRDCSIAAVMPLCCIFFGQNITSSNLLLCHQGKEAPAVNIKSFYLWDQCWFFIAVSSTTFFLPVLKYFCFLFFD